MKPANDDADAALDLRKKFVSDFRIRASSSMTTDQIEEWQGQLAALITAWLMEDGISREDLKSGQDLSELSEQALALLRIGQIATLTFRDAARKLVDDGVTEFDRLQWYPGGKEAALASLLAKFRKFAADAGLVSEADIEFTGLLMLTQVSMAVNARMEALVARLKGELSDGEEPPREP